MLSSVAGGGRLEQTAERFAAVGTTALILTKLDEATGPGQRAAAAALEPLAAELPDQRPERARRHRSGRCPPLGAPDPGNGGASEN